MAKSVLSKQSPKRPSKPPAKSAAKKSAKPAKKSAPKPAAPKATSTKANRIASKTPSPSASKSKAATKPAATTKPATGKASKAPAPKTSPAPKSVVTKNAKPVPAGAKSAPVSSVKATNGKSATIVPGKAAAKAANGAKLAAPAEPPKVVSNGRPMLMQGPVASKALSKKGTFVLSKTPTVAPKPVKRKIERPEPTFVTLQPPVPQVRTSEKAVKNRAGLSQKELDFFRDLLLQKRRELVGDLSHMEREALRENNSHAASMPVDPTDQGTDAYEQEFTLGLVEKDRTLLREINDAMAKIQNGSYGICEGTGNPISRPRLEAQPWARHSIEFARILEKRKMVFRR